jgi:hypothetical protein
MLMMIKGDHNYLRKLISFCEGSTERNLLVVVWKKDVQEGSEVEEVR